MRSTITDADQDGVSAIVDQQFGYAARISAAGLVPIIEPEVRISSPPKDQAETLLSDALRTNWKEHQPKRMVMPTFAAASPLPTDIACARSA